MSRLLFRVSPGSKNVFVVRKCSSEALSAPVPAALPIPTAVDGDRSDIKYPKIEDQSFLSRIIRKRQQQYESIKKIFTIEEKMIKINMPKYYGWKTFMLEHGNLPVQTLSAVQHITKTQIIVNDALPDFYLPISSAAEYHAQQLRPLIEEIIVGEYRGTKIFDYDINQSTEKQYDYFMSQIIVRQLNRVILNYLSNNVPHLMDCQVDFDPRFESFWKVGGMDPPVNIKYLRTFKKRWQRPYRNEPFDRFFQYLGKPLLSLRSELPLEPLLSGSELDNLEYDVPFNKYEPLALGFVETKRHGTCIPGFWPGDKGEFGLISFHPREYLIDTPKSHNEEEKLEKLHSHGIISSYGWAFAQACYQGFTSFNEITYPFTAQTVITNGQYWSFYAYQLNTVLLVRDNVKDESTKNVCFATSPMKLFEGIDDSGGVVGFNENVLKLLLQFYLNAPKERIDTVMKPYLNGKYYYVANMEANCKRIWLDRQFKHMVSNRPRHKLEPEMYDWERIYKYYFNTRPMDGRKRFFEVGLNRKNKPMDAFTGKYVPKILRTKRGNPKHERKFFPKDY